MITGVLTGFVSLSDEFPSFVIPYFSFSNSNFVFAQDLSFDGMVKEFKIINPSHFYSIPVLPPAISVDTDGPGVMAFWHDEGDVWVGSPELIKSRLANLDEGTLPAFVAVEAMTLLGDEERLARAATRAASKLINQGAATAFKGRMIARSRYIEHLIAYDKSTKNTEFHVGLEEVLVKLQSDLADRQWYDLWSEVWKIFNKADDLFGILKWKMAIGIGTQTQISCISTLCYQASDEHKAYILSWMEKNLTRFAGWSSIWSNLHSSKYGLVDPNLYSVGLAYVERYSGGEVHPQVDHQWCVVWNRLWRENFRRDRLIEAAKSAASRSMRHSDSFVRLVLRPIKREMDEPHWQIEFMLNWLSKPQANTIWIDNYVEYYDRFIGRAMFREAGVNWLTRLGGGMNIWARLWKEMVRHEPAEIMIPLALSWLQRARKDLNAWPNVFADTFQMMHSRPSGELVEIARDWIKESTGTRRYNSLIRAVAEGWRSEDASVSHSSQII